MQTFRRLLAALACVVVALASFALSYVALRDVAVAVEAVPASLAWLVPLVIDGGVICGSAVIWSLSKETERRPIFPFLFVAFLVVVSVVVNVNHAGPSLLAKSIAALPPLILLGTLELVASQGRRNDARRSSDAEALESTLVPVAAPVPVAPVATVPDAVVPELDVDSPAEEAPSSLVASSSPPVIPTQVPHSEPVTSPRPASSRASAKAVRPATARLTKATTRPAADTVKTERAAPARRATKTTVPRKEIKVRALPADESPEVS